MVSESWLGDPLLEKHKVSLNVFMYLSKKQWGALNIKLERVQEENLEVGIYGIKFWSYAKFLTNMASRFIQAVFGYVLLYSVFSDSVHISSHVSARGGGGGEPKLLKC